MSAFEWTYFGVMLALTLGVAYLYLLALFGLIGSDRKGELSASHDFLVIIPAHNEQESIARTLKSMARLERPGRVEIAVVADNCTDQTAEIARGLGATVLGRSNLEEIGKGYALQWALAQYDLADFSAVAVVDADTQVEPNMLVAMARAFENGAGGVQVRNELAPVEGSRLADLQHMASVVENILFYRGRSVVGLPILLRGTGMAVTTETLSAHPWDSHSLTEDVDYAVRVIRTGTKVSFASETKVTSAASSTYQQSLSQKKRWASGTFNLIFDHFFPLLWQGLTRVRPALVELAFSLLLLSRPTLILACIVLWPLALLMGPSLQPWILWWPPLLAVLLMLYLCFGVLLVKDKKKALAALLYIPFFGLWLTGVQLMALLERRRLIWTRTDRNKQ